MGDELDYHALSFHEHNPDGMSPGMEHAEGVRVLKQLYKIFPNVSVCTSNHTSRVFRRAMNAGIPKVFIRDYRDFLSAPSGWEWRDRWVVDSVQYLHGEGFNGINGAINAAKQHRQSTVIGHSHSFGGVQYLQGNKDRIFGAQTGCLVDDKAYAFAYGRFFPNKPTLGCGIVLEGREAYFVPMI